MMVVTQILDWFHRWNLWPAIELTTIVTFIGVAIALVVAIGDEWLR